MDSSPQTPKTLLTAADMSQLEIRIAAYMSRDPLMLDILRQNRDMHCVMAQAVYGTPDERRVKDGGSITDAMRNTAKVGNYEAGYGGGWTKLIEIVEKMVLSDTSGSGLTVPTPDEAKEILKTHHRLFKRYWEWVGWTIQHARINGYSVTAFGRPRYSEDINSHAEKYRLEAERALVNHTIQGTAADLMKRAMVNISRDSIMCDRGKMVLQVHDEIVSVVAADWVKWYEQRIDLHMQLGQPFKPYVELVVDVNSAFRWKDCHK